MVIALVKSYFYTEREMLNNIENIVCIFALFEMVLANNNTGEFYFASVPLYSIYGVYSVYVMADGDNGTSIMIFWHYTRC